MKSRDAIAAFIAFNRAFVGSDRPHDDLRLKLDKSAASPLGMARERLDHLARSAGCEAVERDALYNLYPRTKEAVPA